MTIRFSIDQWSAWAPGLTDQRAWQEWLQTPHPLMNVEGSPALAEMPAMMRRRVEKLGRAALQSAYQAQANASACPVIFASRYGEIARSVELLTQLAAGHTVSPTGFSMSVHNAIGALFSIARQDTGQYTSIAAGDETVEAAFIEACSLLADGAASVLIVIYDEPLPPPYQEFDETNSFTRAWACRISSADKGGYSLQAAHAIADATASTASQLSPDLAALKFITSAATSYRRASNGRSWHWQCHD